MRKIPKQQELSHIGDVNNFGEEGANNLHSNGVSSGALQTRPTLNAGQVIEEEGRLTYGDGCGVKVTKWFPRHQIKIRRKQLVRSGYHVHKIEHRELLCDLFLLPNNHLDRQIVEVISS